MKQPKSFKLIDGEFTPTEAGQVVNALISSKLSFHSMQKFSNVERFGKDANQCEKRMAALKKLKLSIKKVLDAAEKKGLNVKMDGLIDITIIE